MNEHTLHGFADEMMKVAKRKDSGINWPRLLGIAAATGLGIGFLKGKSEKFLEKKLGWGLARGLTSGGAGAAYASATAMGLKKRRKK